MLPLTTHSIIKLNEKIESAGSSAKVLTDPQGTTIEAQITFISISAQLEQMVQPGSQAKLFFTIQDSKADQFFTSVAKHPVNDAAPKSKEVLRAVFSERYNFSISPDTEFLQVKVMAAITEAGGESEQGSEKLIQAFKYRMHENYAKLYDQKPHMVQMNNNTCAIGLRVRWLHNADVLKLEEKQADLAKKVHLLDREKSQLDRIVKLHRSIQEELDRT